MIVLVTNHVDNNYALRLALRLDVDSGQALEQIGLVEEVARNYPAI